MKAKQITNKMLDVHQKLFSENGKLNWTGTFFLLTKTIYSWHGEKPEFPFLEQRKEIRKRIIDMILTNDEGKELLTKIIRTTSKSDGGRNK